MIQRLSILAIVAMTLAACDKPAVQKAPPGVPADLSLVAQSAEFKRQVIKVTDGVYVAVGFGIANSILLEGDDGVAIVDTLSTRESAAAALTAFRAITSKPVKALIYTHSHLDHIGGAQAFMQENTAIPIYAQEDVATDVAALASELNPVLMRRAQRMYGVPLPKQDLINVGIGPRLDIDPDSHVALLAPTQTFKDRLNVTIAGLRLELVHAPGETDDELFVWLPDKRVLLAGDDIYHAFPNLYTIRGTTYRDPKKWAASLDLMRALKPAFLVPSHTRPLTGEAQIDTVLTDYRDAIRFTYDQTIRLINQGLGPDEIAHRLKLPQHLASDPWLQEFYGKLSWSSKSVFAGQLGWFDGDPAHLEPLEPSDEAHRMVALAGGQAALDRQITEAQARTDWQWVLQLTGYALRTNPTDTTAKAARIAALQGSAQAEQNANARNYYLTAALELRDGLVLGDRMAPPSPEAVAAVPLSAYFGGLEVNLDAEAAANVSKAVAFEFTDTGERYTVTVHEGVARVVAGMAPEASIQVKVTSTVFKEMLAGLRNPIVTIAKNIEVVRGGTLEFVAFMKLFKPT